MFFGVKTLRSMSDSALAHARKCVFVIGPTASGKSAVAVRIAKALNGEIVNCDAMQCYKGLDIVTNKMTSDEMGGVPHHMLSFLDPFSTTLFDIRQFSALAHEKIEDIHRRKRLPVVCGGTNYYVQSLLLKSSLVSEQAEDREQDDSLRIELEKRSSTDLYSELQKVDPGMAAKLHENDKRKIVRALQVAREQGKPLSEVLASQQAEGLGTFQPSNMRYDAYVLCTMAPRDLLSARIDARVDEMFKAGLMDEIRDFHSKIPDPSAFTNQGLLQSIGFKEFLPYLRDQVSLEACKQAVKVRTRRYAIRQIQWIDRQFVGRGLPVFKTESPWMSDDKGKATIQEVLSSVQSYLSVPNWYEELFTDPVACTVPNVSRVQLWRREQIVSRPETTLSWRKFHCDVCKTTMNGEHEWTQHQESYRHRREVHRARRRTEAFKPTEASESDGKS